MPTEKTITLYQYHELSDEAKERAKQWWAECWDPSDYESTIDDFHTICDKLGISLKMEPVKLMGGGTRMEPAVQYSVGYCQSDYAAFEGFYSYAKGGAAAVKDYAPTDTTLHAIADRLTAEQKANGYRLSATITYHHYYGLQVDVTKGDSEEYHDEAALKEIFRDLCQWLYYRLREEDEYRMSDEAVEDAMSANEYTFREDGKRED